MGLDRSGIAAIAVPRIDMGTKDGISYNLPVDREPQRLPRWLRYLAGPARFIAWFLFVLLIAISLVILPFATWLKELTGGE
jgi:hypothetical protein